MKIFLTGATGFIGGHVVDLLLADGHEIHALVRDTTKAVALAEQGVTLFQGDIRDKDSLVAGMTGCDTVIHMAAWYALGEPRFRKQAEAINVEGTRNVLSLAHALKTPKIVYTSTLGTRGDTKGVIYDEAYHPADTAALHTHYERTKWAAHNVVLDLIQEGAPIMILMPGIVFGAGDQSGYGDALGYYLKGWLFAVIAPKMGVTYVHVKDVAAAHVAAVKKGVGGESYIVSGPLLTHAELFEVWAKVLGRKPLGLKIPAWIMKPSAPLMTMLEYILPLPSFFRGETIKSLGATWYGKSDKAKEMLGWEPKPVEERLRETFEEMGVL